MKHIKYSIYAFSILLVAVGCGGSGQTVDDSGYMPEMTNDQLIRSNELVDGAPIWITMPPTDDENYLYAVGQTTGSSFTQQATIMTAENQARQAMAQKLETKVQALQKNFMETVTSADRQNYDATFTNVNKQTADQALQGTTPARTRCIPMNNEGGGNVNERCYVLMRMPVGPAKTAYENALSRDEELYVKFKASKAYQELKEEFSSVGND